ncbi:peptidase prolyl oligopeptidase active site region [Moniliophthora roreri]|nr:peptidase prolyl oligopeptidase active site region [Moniliophthora roreri]
MPQIRFMSMEVALLPYTTELPIFQTSRTEESIVSPLRMTERRLKLLLQTTSPTAMPIWPSIPSTPISLSRFLKITQTIHLRQS